MGLPSTAHPSANSLTMSGQPFSAGALAVPEETSCFRALDSDSAGAVCVGAGRAAGVRSSQWDRGTGAREKEPWHT